MTCGTCSTVALIFAYSVTKAEFTNLRKSPNSRAKPHILPFIATEDRLYSHTFAEYMLLILALLTVLYALV